MTHTKQFSVFSFRMNCSYAIGISEITFRYSLLVHYFSSLSKMLFSPVAESCVSWLLMVLVGNLIVSHGLNQPGMVDR